MKKQFFYTCGSGNIHGKGFTSRERAKRKALEALKSSSSASSTPIHFPSSSSSISLPKKRVKSNNSSATRSPLCEDVYKQLGFELIQPPIGQGASGLVFRIKNRPDLVLKEQNVGSPQLKTDFMNEVRALTDLQGQTVSYNGREWRIVPNIAASGTCSEESILASSGYSEQGYIVMERLQPVREMTREWKDKAYAVLERAKELGCLQVDVKQDNFMNNENGDPMLIDWGWGWCSGWGEPTPQNYAHDYQDLMTDHGFVGLNNWQALNVYDLLR